MKIILFDGELEQVVHVQALPREGDTIVFEYNGVELVTMVESVQHNTIQKELICSTMAWQPANEE